MQITHPRTVPSSRLRPRAFSLVELVVVIGIIALLMAMLLPAVKNARLQANSVVCKVNLRSIGQLLIIYANNNKGVLYPVGSVVGPFEPWAKPGTYRTLGNMSHYADGSIIPRDGRWPVYVFDPPIWNPKVMVCPQDQEVWSDPTGEQHSYLLNHYIEESPDRMVRWGTGGSINGYSGTEPIRRPYEKVVLMGEKVTSHGDYYMERGDFDNGLVEKYRHGIKLGSNYLYMDMHVDTVPPQWAAEDSADPWEPVPAPVPPGP
jgi:prepilin-type N-terminal cleavage/methylation domain-containing protein